MAIKCAKVGALRCVRWSRRSMGELVSPSWAVLDDEDVKTSKKRVPQSG